MRRQGQRPRRSTADAVGARRAALDTHRADITLEQLTTEMAGGSELEELSHELREINPEVVVDDVQKGQEGT